MYVRIVYNVVTVFSFIGDSFIICVYPRNDGARRAPLVRASPEFPVSQKLETSARILMHAPVREVFVSRSNFSSPATSLPKLKTLGGVGITFSITIFVFITFLVDNSKSKRRDVRSLLWQALWLARLFSRCWFGRLSLSPSALWDVSKSRALHSVARGRV